MSDLPDSANPFAAPTSVAPVAAPSHAVPLTPGKNTILPRYLAASADLVGAFVLSLIVFKLLPDEATLLQTIAAVGTWFGYFFFSEWLLSATPGKLLTGVTIATLDGGRIDWRQAGIRTLLRIVEVNPFIIGAIPAAICILITQRRQRLGDMLAGTVVVRRSRSR